MMPGIDVSDVRIRFPGKRAGNLVGWASCVVSGGLWLNNIEIRRHADGALLLRFPARASRGGQRQHFFRPLDSETRKVIEDAIFAELRSRVPARTNGGE